jgi:protein SCO1
MRKTQKVVIMISVLLAPIFVFLFLKKFGANEFELPIYYLEGNPITECSGGTQQHKISLEAINNYSIKLPVLFYVASSSQNEYYSDLNNVLEKYPKVNIRELSAADDKVSEGDKTSINLTPENFLHFINCELVLGENKPLTTAVVNKYVLIDTERRIRGYYLVDNLDEIERLDVELDILLNY